MDRLTIHTEGMEFDFQVLLRSVANSENGMLDRVNAILSSEGITSNEGPCLVVG